MLYICILSNKFNLNQATSVSHYTHHNDTRHNCIRYGCAACVENKPVMLIVIILNVAILSVVASF